MTIKLTNVLSVAAATRKIGYAFFIDGTPYDWGVSVKGAVSPEEAYRHTTRWIEYYRPDLLVTERVDALARKGKISRALINHIMKAAQDNDVPWALVERVQRFENKYQEADALAERFPELKPHLPKFRMLWQSEPRSTILFEAVALGLEAIEGDDSGQMELPFRN